jgi:hypothetical protein
MPLRLVAFATEFRRFFIGEIVAWASNTLPLMGRVGPPFDKLRVPGWGDLL